MKPLKSIEAEFTDCCKAWKPFFKKRHGVSAWCCHHAIHLEPLRDHPQIRINYIFSFKDVSEQAIRFRNFRPVRVKLPLRLAKVLTAWRKARTAFDKIPPRDGAYKACEKASAAFRRASRACELELRRLHDLDWPDHTWNGETIFSI